MRAREAAIGRALDPSWGASRGCVRPHRKDDYETAVFNGGQANSAAVDAVCAARGPSATAGGRAIGSAPTGSTLERTRNPRSSIGCPTRRPGEAGALPPRPDAAQAVQRLDRQAVV